MKIKIGSRWVATGRNLDRFEVVISELVATPNNPWPSVKTECGQVYIKPFFLANFTPIEEQTVRDFRVGDKVKVEFEGVVIRGESDKVWITSEFATAWYKTEKVKLLEPAKPKLEVGQVWLSVNKRIRKILAIHDYEVAYSLQGETGIHVDNDESFSEDYAHKLLSEAPDVPK